MQRILAHGVLQRKLTINQPGDVYEQEADRVAEAVMRMPDPAATPQRVTQVGSAAGVQRACSCGSSSGTSGQCEECKSKAMSLQRISNGSSSTAEVTAPPIVHDVLRSPGQSLDAATRTFMEPRFGHDFSRVRVHTDARAAESARAVNALAYTVGRDVVFAVGQHMPGSRTGLRLLAHELAHTMQQDRGAARVQRQADLSKVPGKLTCPVAVGEERPSGTDLLFSISSSKLTPGQKSDVAAFAKAWVAAGSKDPIRVDGYASVDGPQEMNWTLSCDRALAIKQQLIADGVLERIISTVAHGETDQFGKALSPNRRAIISMQTAQIAPTPPPPPTSQKVDPVKVPADSKIETKGKGTLSPDAPPKDPTIDVKKGGEQNVVPNDSAKKTNPPPPDNLVEVTGEVDAQLKVFSKGEDPASAASDPCRRFEVDAKLNMKLKVDGVGIGNRVHLFYHEPTMSVSLPLPPCNSLPEIKWELDFVNTEIVPQILELSLKPGLTFGDGQFKPGSSIEVEYKPFGKANNFLSHFKISGELEVLSEKQDKKRSVVTTGTFHIGAEF